MPSSRIWHKVSAATHGERSPMNAYYSTRNFLLLARKHGRLGVIMHIKASLKFLWAMMLLMVGLERGRHFQVIRGRSIFI